MLITDTCIGSIISTSSGIAADSVEGDKHYTHKQPIAAMVWTIPHGLGKYPTVQTFDAGLDHIEGVWSHIDTNTMVVEFNVDVSGVAYLN